MDARDIILRPVATERSINLMDDKKYTFDAFVLTTGTQVRNVVEEIFDVKVKNVNIINVRGKKKRVGRYAGKTVRRGKTVVTLTEDSNGTKIFNDNKENQ